MSPYLPELLYIGLKLIPKIPYKISVLPMFFFTDICINDIMQVTNYTYVRRNQHGILGLFKTQKWHYVRL